MHKLSNIRFNADKRDYAHLQIKRMLAAEYDYDTLRIFSSGTDAARINQQRCFACAKLAIKSVHGCTLLMMRQRRCAVSPALLKIVVPDTRREQKNTRRHAQR